MQRLNPISISCPLIYCLLSYLMVEGLSPLVDFRNYNMFGKDINISMHFVAKRCNCLLYQSLDCLIFKRNTKSFLSVCLLQTSNIGLYIEKTLSYDFRLRGRFIAQTALQRKVSFLSIGISCHPSKTSNTTKCEPKNTPNDSYQSHSAINTKVSFCQNFFCLIQKCGNYLCFYAFE